MKKMLPHHPKVMELGTEWDGVEGEREGGNPFWEGPSISALSKSTENRFVATRGSKWEKRMCSGYRLTFRFTIEGFNHS